MYLDGRDVWRLINDLKYLKIAKLHSAKFYLKKLLRDVEELEHLFLQYPSVRYEPLDDHYVLLQYLGALNEDLVSDLCGEYDQYNWRGVVSACWLAIFLPNKSYYKHFLQVREKVHSGNKWFVDFVLAELEQKDWQPDLEFQMLVRRFRCLLAKVTFPHVVLRAYPNTEQLAKIQEEQDDVARAYKSGGLEGALSALNSTYFLKVYLSQDHP